MPHTPGFDPDATIDYGGDALREYDRLCVSGPPQAARLALLNLLVDASEADWLSCSRTLVLRGDTATARAVLSVAHTSHPSSIDLCFALAGILQQEGEQAAAEALLRELLAQQPGHAAATFLLAHILRQQGRMHAMASAVRALFKHGQHDLAIVIQAIELLDDCDRKQDASAICEAEIAAGSTDPRIYAYAGMLEIQLGAFERARQHYAFALDHSSLAALEWNIPIGLSSMQRYRDASHPDFELFQRGLKQPGLSDKARTTLLFALGKAYDDIGDYSQATRHLRQANALAQTATSWSRKNWRRATDARLARKPMSLTLMRPADWTPIFIVGVPRSGTTLVAELLSRHPDVCNRGELGWLAKLARPLSMQDERNIPAFEQAAATYAAQLLQDDSDAHWFIDKQPLNLLHVDLILALWPNARIIYCRRSPRDTALSLWSQSFLDEAQGYAYDFINIATVIKDCERLMTHWQKRYASSIYTVRYEQLTAEPTAIIAALADWLPLPEPNSSAATPKSSVISTASLWQARQPVYTRSVERWRNYADQLPELLRIPES